MQTFRTDRTLLPGCELAQLVRMRRADPASGQKSLTASTARRKTPPRLREGGGKAGQETE